MHCIGYPQFPQFPILQESDMSYAADFETKRSSFQEGKEMSDFSFISSKCTPFFDRNGIFYSMTGCLAHINSHAYML